MAIQQFDTIKILNVILAANYNITVVCTMCNVNMIINQFYAFFWGSQKYKKRVYGLIILNHEMNPIHSSQ